MAEIKDQNTKGIKLFGATILSQELISRKDATTIKDEEEEEEREFKRPEKLIPCPRCKSMETKFCYFNNYNVNQPRHYCKGCQRYWTAGGALRNVPVGAGRRKAKPPGLFSDCCYLFETSTETNDEDGFGRRDGVVDEEWRVAEHGRFRHVFQAKRRRNASNSQHC